MILTVLGNNGPYPAANGACSGYLVSSDSGRTHLLLDVGSGVLSRLLDCLPIASLDALVLSHLHFDHMSDALPLKYALDASDRQNLYTIAPDKPENVRTLLEGGKLDLTLPEDQYVGELRLSFIPSVHPVDCFSVCVEEGGRRLIYTGDTNENDALELFAHKADLLLADAGLSDADWKERSPHLSAKRCGELARRCQVKRLLLTHLSPRYEADALLGEAREAYPGAEIARLGMTARV